MELSIQGPHSSEESSPTNDLLMPDGFNLFCKLFPISKAMKIQFFSPPAVEILFVHKQIVFLGHPEKKIHNLWCRFRQQFWICDGNRSENREK